ncbi:hypothetical protein HII31_13023 [Pseudocercospora fuligena]|uniref:Uncharacterized protein n=1 Tax=Pseudocercospora fuligena TaxID=685502 RepID=A0A8H6R6U9_9PEZI|nr:hypothetical protein HII31_13023 [Pseudocercospora fuligena]
MSEPVINFRPILDCWDDPNKWFPCFMISRRGLRRDAATSQGYVPPGTTCRRDDKTRPHTACQREKANALVSDRYWEVLRMRRKGGLSELDLRKGEMGLSKAIMDFMKLTACARHFEELLTPDDNNDLGKQWVAELTKMILAREPTDEVPKFDPKAFGAGRLKSRSTGVKRKHGSSGPDEPEQAVANSKRVRSSNPSDDADDMPGQSTFIPSCSVSHQTGFGNPTQENRQQKTLLDDQALQFFLNDDQAFWDPSIPFPQYGSAPDTSSLPEFTSTTHQSSISESSTNSTNSRWSFSSNTSLDSDIDSKNNNTQHLPIDEATDYGMFLVCNTCARDLSQHHKPFCAAMQQQICQEPHDHEYSICCTGREYIPVREFCAGGACMVNAACDVDECWEYPCWDEGHKRWEIWRHDSGCWASFSQGEVAGADLLPGDGMGEDSQKDLEEISGIESQDEKTSDSAPHLVFAGNGELTAEELGLEEEDWEKALEEFLNHDAFGQEEDLTARYIPA